MTLKKAIESLFQQYVQAFSEQDIESVSNCYQLPCTMHTPDRVVLINDQQSFTTEFNGIFSQLTQADIYAFKALQASFSQVTENLCLVAIDWQFIDKTGQVFTDFSAFYHIAFIEQQWRIINVVSQELSQSKCLATVIKIHD